MPVQQNKPEEQDDALDRPDEPGMDSEDTDAGVSGSGLDDLTIRDADDPSLGITNVGNIGPDDWAADTGPARAPEAEDGIAWDQLNSRPPKPRK